MKTVRELSIALLCLAVSGAVGAGAWMLITAKPSESKADKPASPAKVDKVVKEEDLGNVSISEEAYGRLGVRVAPAAKRNVARTRTYGGEVVIPPGRTVVVAAPLGGIVKAAAMGSASAGQAVKRGQAVLTLSPLLTPEARTTIASSQVDTDGQVKNAQTAVEAAKIALDRATRLFRSESGSQRGVDEAQATWQLAVDTLRAATARQELLTRILGDIQSGTAAPIAIESPSDGLLRTISALPGQNVPAGAALFEVIDPSTVWVRVALPVSDRDELDLTRPVSLGSLSVNSPAKGLAGKPVAAPPSANPLTSTVDVFYEVANPEMKLIPGQRLAATLAMKQNQSSLTVPWGSVVYDIFGNTWVYVEVSPRVYQRRRVVVEYVGDDRAVLAGGVAEGTGVVVEGSQELFASETGFKK